MVRAQADVVKALQLNIRQVVRRLVEEAHMEVRRVCLFCRAICYLNRTAQLCDCTHRLPWHSSQLQYTQPYNPSTSRVLAGCHRTRIVLQLLAHALWLTPDTSTAALEFRCNGSSDGEA